ncbi:MAG: radical SAM protein [Bacteroidales bacterium]|jgi:uncharacterized protein|nr:radical SAM protein [Bacteroidales bacterium]
MKYSQYNTIIELSNSVFSLYNAKSDRFVVIKNEILSHLQLNPKQLQIKNLELYEELKNAEAIIADDVDEFALMKTLSRNIDTDTKEVRLIINPTLDCNLKCWYCYENHIKGSKISSDTADRIKKYTTKIFENNNKIEHFQLYFFGGEPLMPLNRVIEIINFVSYCCNHNQVSFGVSFTSNGVLINDKLMKCLQPLAQDVSFQITLDGGRDFHDKVRFLHSGTGTYQTILHNVQLLLQNKIFVVLRINFTKDNIDSVPCILEDIRNLSKEQKDFLKIDFQRVWQDDDDPVNIDPLLDSFHQAGFAASSPSHHLDQLKHPCYADRINELLINYNGDVYKCTARDFTIENRSGFLTEDGTVVWTGLTPMERIEQKMRIHICKECAILPLCGGGCSQKCNEFDTDASCVYHYDEADKKKIILDRFYNYFVNK